LHIGADWLGARFGGGGDAGGLVVFQLEEAAVYGTLDAGFIACQLSERVGTGGVDGESAGGQVAVVGRGERRRRGVVLVGPLYVIGVPFLAGRVAVGDFLEKIAVDTGFHGEAAAETPLMGGDTQDQVLFGGADGLEAVQMVVEEDDESGGILVEQDVFVGAQAVQEAIAAGCGFSFGGAGAGGLFGVFAVGMDAGLGRGVRFVRICHMWRAVCGPLLSLTY
jgi:hypothetical protein